MRILPLIFFSFFFTSAKVHAQDLCLVSNHIFLIHGIGGSAKSFGEMENVLKKVDECYVLRSFEYDTGNSSLSTQDFAESFHQFVGTKFSLGEIKPQDKISLIMHSQGGIVGNFWLNTIRTENPFLYHQIDAFITLSTPHWGAEMAGVGEKLSFALPRGILGKVELNEMSFGSSSIRNLSAQFAQALKPVNFRPLAVGGVHKIKQKLIGENDLVVPVYSSRPDHFTATESITLGTPRGDISLSAFTKTNRIPFVTIAATHIKLDLPGIVQIPQECLAVTGCDHPSLPIITEHLKGRSIASDPEKLNSFRVSLYLSNSSSSKLKKNDLGLRIIKAREVSIPLSQRLRNFRGEASLTDGVAFSFHGTTKIYGIQTITLELTLKNKFSTTIEVPVEGGHSSLLQISLND